MNDTAKINKIINHFKRNMRGGVTYEKATQYIKRKGYSIILFDEETEDIERFGLRNIASVRLAFTYRDNVRIIFIKRSCIKSQKLSLLLHEIGHILLNHLDDEATTADEKECQANYFACSVMEEKTLKPFVVIYSFALAASIFCNIILVLNL